MVNPVPSVLELLNQCFEDVFEIEFKTTCHDLVFNTDYFDQYETDKTGFIDESNYCIGFIGRYLRRFTGRAEITAKLFRKKFKEITEQIIQDMYRPGNSEPVGSGSDDASLPWTEIELTTCGEHKETPNVGPSLEQFISSYNTDWCKKKELFDVKPDRPGIQIIRIPKTGLYEIKAWGAGNVNKTASGIEFTNN